MPFQSPHNLAHLGLVVDKHLAYFFGREPWTCESWPEDPVSHLYIAQPKIFPKIIIFVLTTFQAMLYSINPAFLVQILVGCFSK